MYINVVYTIGSWISQSLYNIPFWEMSVELRSPFSDLSSFLNSLDSSIREFSFSMKPPSTSSSCTVNMTAALYWRHNYYHLTANLFLANQHVQLQKCCTRFLTNNPLLTEKISCLTSWKSQVSPKFEQQLHQK